MQKKIFTAGLAFLLSSPIQEYASLPVVTIHAPKPVVVSDTTTYLATYDQTLAYWQEAYNNQASLQELAVALEQKGFNQNEVKSILRNARIDSTVTKLFNRNILLSADKKEMSFADFAQKINLEWFVKEAQPFAEKHQEALAQAEETTGVDYRYIVGILGIETRYGQTLGKHNLINSLVTQYATTRRKTFAVNELASVLHLSKQYNEDLTTLTGSYAGALGVGQWIPSSIYNIAQINSLQDIYDIEKMIPSIGHYLKRGGWDESKNKEELKPDSKNYRAIKSYNNSDTYVQTVKAISEGVKK